MPRRDLLYTCLYYTLFVAIFEYNIWFKVKGLVGLVYWGLTPQQQPGPYQGGELMMMKSVFWWRKPEYPEETI